MAGVLKACLAGLLRSSTLANSQTASGVLVLKESDRTSRMSVEIHGAPRDLAAVCLAKTSQHPALKEGHEATRICDYLLIAESSDGKSCHVLLVEMKKTLDEKNRRRGLAQLRRSLPMVEYLISACAVELKQAHWPHTVGYVLLAEQHAPRTDKQPTHASPPQRQSHDGIEVTVAVGLMFPYERLVA